MARRGCSDKSGAARADAREVPVRNGGFVDYYEVLQVNPRAETGTINRIYRHLAKRFHPDNCETGDRKMFDQLAEAHETLSNSDKRAAYDLLYADAVDDRLHLLDEAIGCESRDDDRTVRERLLSVLYTQRRRDLLDPGIGEIQLERLLACPREHLAFHLWYLREKKFVERTDRGFAITVLGIDEVEAARTRTRDGQAQITAGGPTTT
jgi:curved DNA-binding protein CbpA